MWRGANCRVPRSAQARVSVPCWPTRAPRDLGVIMGKIVEISLEPRVQPGKREAADGVDIAAQDLAKRLNEVARERKVLGARDLDRARRQEQAARHLRCGRGGLLAQPVEKRDFAKEIAGFREEQRGVSALPLSDPQAHLL